MKKARQIVIPEDRPLTFEEFYDFDLHARNSSVWYATEYTRSEQQVIEKLLAKGYTRDDVEYVDKDGVEHRANIIDNVLATLRENFLVSDDSYALGLINRYRGSKRGDSYIRRQVISKGIDAEVVDRLLEETADEEKTFEAIEALAERYMNSSAYLRVEEEFKRRQKLTTHLVSRGFSFSDIQDWKDQREE